MESAVKPEFKYETFDIMWLLDAVFVSTNVYF